MEHFRSGVEREVLIRASAAREALHATQAQGSPPPGRSRIARDFLDPRKNAYVDSATGYTPLAWSEGSPRSLLQGPSSPPRGYALGVEREEGRIGNAADVDVFSLLYDYMKTNRTRGYETFRRFDRNNDGQLDYKEVSQMMQELLPGTTMGDVDYFFAMLDANREDSISFKELQQAVQECYQYSRALRRQEPAAQKVIHRLQQYLKKHNYDARSAFQRFDSSKNGFLEYAEVARMIRDVLPSIKLAELRYIMAHFKSFDQNSEGRLSYAELQDRLEPDWLKLSRIKEVQRRWQQEEEVRFRNSQAENMEKERQQGEAMIRREEERLELQQQKEEEDRKEREIQERKEAEERRKEAERAAARHAEERRLAMERQLQEEERMRQLEAEKRRREQEDAQRTLAEKEARRRQVEAARMAEEEEEKRLKYLAEKHLREEQELRRQLEKKREEEEEARRRQEEEERRAAAIRLAQWRARKFKRYKYVDVKAYEDEDSARGPHAYNIVKDGPTTDPELLRSDDGTKVWAAVRMVDIKERDSSKYPGGSLARYFPTPESKKYGYYKYYGFGGRGAITSWGHNPTKKPVQMWYPWLDSESDAAKDRHLYC